MIDLDLNDVNKALDYLYIIKRPNEDVGSYIKRVGITTAAEYAQPLVQGWAREVVAEFGGEGSNFQTGADIGAGAGMDALVRFAQTGEISEGLEAGAKSIAKRGAGALARSAVTSGLASAGVSAGASSALGKVGGGLASMGVKAALGEEITGRDAIYGVAQMTPLAPVTGALSAFEDMMPVIGELVTGRSRKARHAQLSLNTDGKMILANKPGYSAGTNVRGTLEEFGEERGKVERYLNRQRDQRWAEFQEYSKGYSEEDKLKLMRTLGAEYFTPQVHISSTGLRSMGALDDAGVDAAFEEGDKGHGILYRANPDDLGRAKALADAGYSGTMADFSGPSSGGNAEQGNEWSRNTYDDALRISRREQEIQGKIDALDPSDSWGRKSLERARIANDPSKAVQDKQEQIFTQAQQYGQHMYDREN